MIVYRIRKRTRLVPDMPWWVSRVERVEFRIGKEQPTLVWGDTRLFPTWREAMDFAEERAQRDYTRTS